MALMRRGVLTMAKRGWRFHTTGTVCEKDSSFVSNPLLQRLIKESNSGVKAALDAEEANSSLGNEDPILWEPLITSLRHHSSAKSQLVLEWKLEKLLKENERDQGQYCQLICLCEKIQNVPFALQVFCSMEAHGVRPTSAVFNSLILACLSSGNVTTALSLFEIMEGLEDCKPNLGTYNAFITMYSNLGDAKAMQSWYSATKMAGFSPSVQSYDSLIAGSIKSKDIDSASKFYEEMMLSGVAPNVSILENMLQELSEQKIFGRVKQILKFILDGGWKLNGRMAKKLTALYSELGRVEEIEGILLALTGSNQDLEVLSQVHAGIIRMYALSDRLDDLEFSVGRMLKHGMSFTCPDDVEKVICSYFRRAAYDRLDLFLERISGSYKLTRSTYDLLIAGYRRAGLSEKLDLVIKEMKLAGFAGSKLIFFFPLVDR